MSARLALAAILLLAAPAASWAGLDAFPCLLLANLAWLAALPHASRAPWMLVLAVALGGRALLAPSTYRTDDLHRYVWEGRVQNAGHSPYALAPSAPELAALREASFERINHPTHAAIYPPGAELAFRAATAAGLSEEGLRALFLALDAAVVLALLLWLRALGRPAGFALVYAWSPLAALGASAGHLEPLALLPLACAGIAWARARPLACGALLGLAALAKLFPILLLPWLAARRPRAALLGFAPVFALGWMPFLGEGNALGPLLHFGREFAFNGALFQTLDTLAPSAARALAGALLLAASVAITRAPLSFASAAALGSASLLFLSPTVHFWYLAWFLLPLAAVGPRRWNAPLLAWCAAALALYPTYRAAHEGGPFVELAWAWRIEYAIPALVLAWVLLARRARREPLARARAGSAPPGTFAVVIPCRGEAASLRELLPRWLATRAERIVVADTPTGDGTRALCAQDERVHYLEVRRRGYGAAVLAGLEAAGPVDFLVVCDADHAEGPDTVGALLEPLRDPAVGLVCAARATRRGQSGAQRVGNALVLALLARLLGRRFHDLGPFRALRRADWPSGALVDRGFGINVEMHARALRRGIGLVELELPRAPRVHGEDRIGGTWRGVLRAGRDMLMRLLLVALDGRRARVVLLVKVPGALPVKTRLLAQLGERGARELFLAMLRETLGRARVLDPEPTIAFSPPWADARAAFGGLGPVRYLPLAARGGAACLEEALARAFEGEPLLALGADAPDLPLELLRAAERAARAGRAALVPTPDGGFACLALPAPVRGLARAFEFGSGDAAEALEAYLARRGLELEELPPWRDVDTPPDLAAWRRRSGREPGREPRPAEGDARRSELEQRDEPRVVGATGSAGLDGSVG